MANIMPEAAVLDAAVQVPCLHFCECDVCDVCDVCVFIQTQCVCVCELFVQIHRCFIVSYYSFSSSFKDMHTVVCVCVYAYTPTHTTVHVHEQEIRREEPEYGFRRVLGALKVRHADWQVSEKRVRKCFERTSGMCGCAGGRVN